jgi:Ca2+-binding EF-hand superfamily protein
MLKELQEILGDDLKLTHVSKLIIEKLDINRKGYLNKSEIKEFFEEVAEELETQVSQSELEEVFLEIDENSTMKITHEEIKSILKQLLAFLTSSAVYEFS